MQYHLADAVKKSQMIYPQFDRRCFRPVLLFPKLFSGDRYARRQKYQWLLLRFLTERIHQYDGRWHTHVFISDFTG